MTKVFQTLSGFVAGAEADDLEASFRYLAALRVMSPDGLDFAEIEATLGVSPTVARRRGERTGLHGPPSKQDLWMYQAPVDEELELHEHIDALWRILAPHAAYLRALKSRARVDVHLGYSSNIDHAGLTIPCRSLQLFTALELDVGLSIVVTVDDLPVRST